MTAPLRFPASLAGLLLAMPADGWLLRWSLSRMRSAFLDGGSYRQFRRQTLHLRRLESKIRFHRGWKRLMRAWRALHVTLAIMLLGLIGAHVWISVRVGLKWPWS